MKGDDPRLVQAHKEFLERVGNYDDRMVNVLKNHLGAEQALNKLLAAASRRWKRRTFAGKIDVGETLLLEQLHPHVWKVLRVGNDLRNAIAHGDKQGTIAAKVAELRKAYKDSLSPEHRGDADELTDAQLVMMAFTGASSFLIVEAERLDQKRKGKN